MRGQSENARPVPQWVSTIDASGRERLEMRWAVTTAGSAVSPAAAALATIHAA